MPWYLQPQRVFGSYQLTKWLGMGSFGNVWSAVHLQTGSTVAVKVEMPTGKDGEVIVLPYEAAIYKHLRGHHGIPKVHRFGMDGGAHVLVMDQLDVNLEQLRMVCRGRFTLKTLLMLTEQMLTRVEFVHSRGIILRDMKPENFAMGSGKRSSIVHLFDFGLAKLFVGPTGEHMPFREGRDGLGTPRFCSAGVHFGQEQSRRDDMQALGHLLLYLFHGRLPWQGIYAQSIPAKLHRFGEMKSGQALRDLLAVSPPEFTGYFDHCRSLAFEQKPDYTYLKALFRARMEKEGWKYDWRYDWLDGAALEKGTLIPEEYKVNEEFDDSDLTELSLL